MIVEHRSRLPASSGDAFAWHARPGAFERLLPPFESVRLLEPHPGLVPGAQVAMRVVAGPLSTRWVARHTAVEPGVAFTDEQVEGPFARWVHVHRFEPAGPGACELEDRVEVELPGGPLGEVGDPCVRRRVLRTLRYRHRVLAGDLAMHATYRGRRLRIAVTGASGFIGSALVPALTTGGHEVIRLVRRTAGPGEISWDPAAGVLAPDALSGLDAVVHLAGENISAGRWTPARRARLETSRTGGTALLARAIGRAARPPRVLISASATGFYGDRADESLDEASPPGSGFLPDLVRAWEAATAPAEAAGVRTVHTRFGLVLSPDGGVLERLRLPFAMGLGGSLGSGRQWTSWVSRDDVVGAMHHCLVTDTVRGAVNVVAPEPVRNTELAAVLGRVLRRPAVVPVPAFALRLAFGAMADEAVLASARVYPARLEATGYRFRHPGLETALRHVLGRAA